MLDLLNKMLKINQDQRITMDEVLNHKFLTQSPQEYAQQYQKWKARRANKLKDQVQILNEALKKVPADLKPTLEKLQDHEKMVFADICEQDTEGKNYHLSFLEL